MLKQFLNVNHDIHPEIISILMKIAKTHINEIDGDPYEAIDLYRYILKCELEKAKYELQNEKQNYAKQRLEIQRENEKEERINNNGNRCNIENLVPTLREHQDIADVCIYLHICISKSNCFENK